MYQLYLKDRYFLISEEQIKNDPNCKMEMITGEKNLLQNPMIDKVFQKILDTYQPQHKKVIFSLCSSKRPYIKSLKWKAFYERFGHETDLIICSNGGIIPIEYMFCFPYMEYDALRSGIKWDKIYMEIMEKRMIKFLNRFGNYWDKIIHSYLPTSRNYEVIQKSNLKGVLLPTIKTYNQIKKEGSPGVNTQRYPQLAHQAMEEMAKYLDIRLEKQLKKFSLF